MVYGGRFTLCFSNMLGILNRLGVLGDTLYIQLDKTASKTLLFIECVDIYTYAILFFEELVFFPF